ncbi:hypothetical protein JCM10207_000156 [Rhodosporidiobolus poonsookiae]
MTATTRSKAQLRAREGVSFAEPAVPDPVTGTAPAQTVSPIPPPVFSFTSVTPHVHYCTSLDAYLKVIDVDSSTDLFQLSQELDVYRYLEHKRDSAGVLFPRLMGLFRGPGAFGLMTTSVGRPLEENEILDFPDALALPAQLHALGLAHGNLMSSNLAVTPRGTLAFLDFEHASIFEEVGEKWEVYERAIDIDGIRSMVSRAQERVDEARRGQ